MTNNDTSLPAILGPDSVSSVMADALLNGCVAALKPSAVFEVTGPGAVQCVQGVLTNDVEAHGENAFVYGAVLTPKGMIISDLWTARDKNRIWLYAPPNGSEVLKATFSRFFPPRLAKVQDVSQNTSIIQLAGPDTAQAANRAGIDLPEPGTSQQISLASVDCVIQAPLDGIPFVAQLHVNETEVESIFHILENAGFTIASESVTELSRIISGWPLLGAEIDDKTLPQEVRFDEINGVSYTKGCYTGQETVARIHFRGHPNKELMGLFWEEDPSFQEIEITQGQKHMGRVSSIAWIPSLGQYVGMGIIKRTIDHNHPVTAANASAIITPFPISIDF